MSDERARRTTGTLMAGLVILMAAVFVLSAGAATNARTTQIAHAVGNAGLHVNTGGPSLRSGGASAYIQGNFTGSGSKQFSFGDSYGNPTGDSVYVFITVNSTSTVSSLTVSAYTPSSIHHVFTQLDYKNKGIHQWAAIWAFENASWVGNGNTGDSYLVNWTQTSGTTTIGETIADVMGATANDVIGDNQGSKGPAATVTLTTTVANDLVIEAVSEGNGTTYVNATHGSLGAAHYCLGSGYYYSGQPLCNGITYATDTSTGSYTIQGSIAGWAYWDAIAVAIR